MRSPIGPAAQDRRVEHRGPWSRPGFGGAQPGRRRHCDGAADGAWAVAHGRTMRNALEELRQAERLGQEVACSGAQRLGLGRAVPAG